MLQGQEYNEKVCTLLNFRAQDKAAMQLSELEEEMDQRIQAAEHKTRKHVSLWDWPVYAMNPWTTFCVQGTGHSLGYGTSRLPQALSTRALLVVVLRGID